MKKFLAVTTVAIAIVAVLAMVAGTAMADTTYSADAGAVAVVGNDGSLIMEPIVAVGILSTPTTDSRWDTGYNAYLYLVLTLPSDSTQYVFPLTPLGVTNNITPEYHPGATADAPGNVPLFKSVLLPQAQLVDPLGNGQTTGPVAVWMEPLVILPGSIVKALPNLDGTIYLVVLPADTTTLDLSDPDAIVVTAQFQVRSGVVQITSQPQTSGLL